jgi:transcriptional regulator
VDLLAEIRQKAGGRVEGRRVRAEFSIAISTTGELIIS